MSNKGTKLQRHRDTEAQRHKSTLPLCSFAPLSLCKVLFCILFACLLPGCRNGNVEQNQPEIAVTNSYLGCVVEDLCANDTDSALSEQPAKSRILCLAPPGLCPGHFDIAPSQVRRISRCKMLLLFDFQKNAVGAFSRMQKNGLKIHLVQTSPGLCTPQTYLTICTKVCDILCSQYPEKQAQYKLRLSLVESRVKELGDEIQAGLKQAGLDSADVIVSEHQAQFAEWLGLKNVATFLGSDIETAANINHCLSEAQGRNVKFVIANRQEGTALGDILAEQLNVKSVVFSNFPEINFDNLLRENVQALIEAAKR